MDSRGEGMVVIPSGSLPRVRFAAGIQSVRGSGSAMGEGPCGEIPRRRYHAVALW